MARIRKPFQGVINIIRFNWHYFVVSIGLIFLLLFVSNYLIDKYHLIINAICLLVFSSIVFSLAVSYYVYDLSNLYKLDWLDEDISDSPLKIINISAGFDETSELLQKKFNNANLIAFDFYDPKLHTEVSIKRARNAYPRFPNTQSITTSELPLPDSSIDKIFLILSAHEIRESIERTLFFAELKRILKKDGQIILTEHFRDVPNLLAYNIGAFHFLEKDSWLENIENAKLQVVRELKITPFITTFTIEKNGNSH